MLMLVFSALSGARVSLSSISDIISDSTILADAEAYLELQSDGDIIQYTGGTGVADVGDWIAPVGAAGANYEARATVNSGGVTAGTTGSWLSLGTTRRWTCSHPGSGGTTTANITLEIRLASGGSALASKTFDLEATAGF